MGPEQGSVTSTAGEGAPAAPIADGKPLGRRGRAAQRAAAEPAAPVNPLLEAALASLEEPTPAPAAAAVVEPTAAGAAGPERKRRGGKRKVSATVEDNPAGDPELEEVLAAMRRSRSAPESPAAEPAEAAQPVEIDPAVSAVIDSLGATTNGKASAEPAAEPAAEAPARGIGGSLWDFARELNPLKRRPAQPAEAPQVTSEEPAITAEPADAAEPEPAEEAAGIQPEETPAVTAEGPQAVETPAAEEPIVVDESANEPVVSPWRTSAERSRRERITETIAQQIENLQVLGKRLPELAFRGIGLGGIRWGARELAKGIVSWSGAAGAVGGGIAGTALTGAFVGALAGAAVEYVRQVDANLSKIVSAETPDLTSRKAIFLQKLRQTREHREVFTQVDAGKLGKAALFGAITGAGAGAIADIPEVREFLSEENVRRFLPNLGGIGQTATEAVRSAGTFAGNAGNVISQLPGAETVSAMADTGIRTVGDVAGGVAKTGGDIVHAGEEMAGEAGRWANNMRGAVNTSTEAAQQATAVAGEAAKASEGVVSQADFDALKDQLETQRTAYNTLQNQLDALKQTVQPPLTEYVPKADFDNLQQQLTDTKSALATARGATTGVLPSAEQAAAAAHTAAEQAAARATEAAQNQVNEAFANLKLGENYALQSGDSVAGITEKLGKSLGLTPQQSWELGKRLAQEHGIGSQYYGTTGAIPDRLIPTGKVLNMQGVKALASEFLKKKVNT